jgi:hypothetical protein
LKEFKPYNVVLFILLVGLTLAPILLLNPDGKINLGFTELSFISQKDILEPKTQEKKDISKIVASVDTTGLEKVTVLEPKIVEETKVKGRTQKIIEKKQKVNVKKGSSKSKKNDKDESKTLFLNKYALDKLSDFFLKLAKVSEDRKKLHILHYGDSQIEGDRMTAYIRQRIQNQFGGNGPGLIPALNVYVTKTFIQNYSENFTRYTCFGGEKLAQKNYGAMGAAAKFTTDSILKEGWIEIEPSNKAQSRARYYNQVKLFYTDCKVDCKITVYHNNEVILEDSLISDGTYHMLPLQFTGRVGKLKYVFNSDDSPVFCGFSLEGDYGVQVDNIGMRGCSGTIFNRLEKSSFKGMLDDLNSELILLQFGGNSVPYFKDSVGVRRYARVFQSQIKTIKKLYPTAAIIVIGPSDMSLLSNGIYETYKFLPYCVSQMKLAAGKEGAGYWDLFKAMGGKNSMPSWVESGLAGKDYIHFSNKGASIASQMFYDALELEYSKWKLNP